MAVDIKLQIATMLQMASKAGTPEEAANAAAMANKLMLKYKLSRIECMMAAAAGNEKILEAVVEDSVPLVATNRVQAWEGYLSVDLAKANDCKVIKTRKGLIIIGQPSDIANIRMLYAFCQLQLWNMMPRGSGVKFINSWYLGAVAGIGRKIRQTRIEVMNEATTYGLMEVKKTGQRVEEFANKTHNLRPGTESKATIDATAYYKGLFDAERINLHKGDIK